MEKFRHIHSRQADAPAISAAERHPGRSRSVADLRISLLGAIRVTWGGRDIRLAGRNARALVAILALERRMRLREAVAAELWPDLPELEAGSALRQTIWLLKTGIVEAGADAAVILDIDNERIGLRAETPWVLDVAQFEDCVHGHPARVEEAIGLYRGDLAEGHNLESLARDRERLADLVEDALAEASRRRLRDGNLVGARDAALRLLRRDPLREEAHMVLIELYGRIGSRSQVCRQYRRLRAILASELDVEPLQETEDAYRTALRRAASRSDGRTVWLPDRANPSQSRVAVEA
jgi:DNA-binding SARP family transcriptional activator